MAEKKECSVQLKLSQLDNSAGAASDVVHDPWPAHTKKHVSMAPRKSRRQSILIKEFDSLGSVDHEADESTDIAGGYDPAHRERRRSSVRRGSIAFGEQVALCRAKRRQSLLPVLRATSKGEEVTVINGIKSNESVGNNIECGDTATSEHGEKSTPSNGGGDGLINVIKREASEDILAKDEVSPSVSNMKRRSRASSLKEGVASEVSQDLSRSRKLEDQINLQHLVELMRVFNVRPFYKIKTIVKLMCVKINTIPIDNYCSSSQCINFFFELL